LRYDVTHRRCRLFAAGTAFLLIARLGAAADFSADVIDGGGAKIYSSAGKVRIEANGGYFLIANDAAVFVRPAQQFYTDARRSTVLTQLFIPVDPENPCPQWQAAAMNAGVPGAEGAWHCERVEVGPVEWLRVTPADPGPRIIARWRVTPPDQNPRDCWIDPELTFPVRIQMSNGAEFSLHDIDLATQSPELFSVPATYRKLDPHALLERMKHSDVWAAPPSPE
jgi:hypothetical protein